MSPTRILLTGATGYLGGSILTELVKNPAYQIVALVRQEEQAAKLKAAMPSVETVVGALTDLELVKRLGSEVDGE